MDEGRLYLTTHAVTEIEEIMKMTTPSDSRDPGMEGSKINRRADSDDFFEKGETIELQLTRLDDQLGELSERVASLFHHFDVVLMRPVPRPDGGMEKDPSPESMQSGIYDLIGNKKDLVYRVNRQLEELVDRCNL